MAAQLFTKINLYNLCRQAGCFRFSPLTHLQTAPACLPAGRQAANLKKGIYTFLAAAY